MPPGLKGLRSEAFSSSAKQLQAGGLGGLLIEASRTKSRFIGDSDMTGLITSWNIAEFK